MRNPAAACRWWRRQVPALLLCLLASGPASAAELRFITIDAAPWASRKADGTPVGVFPELVAELAARTGHTIAMAFEPDLLGDQSVLARIPLVLQCARRSPHLALMPELNRAIEAMVADGTVARIKQGHGF